MQKPIQTVSQQNIAEVYFADVAYNCLNRQKAKNSQNIACGNA